MTLYEMEYALAKHFDWSKNIIVPNVSWVLLYSHEADILIMNSNGFLTEIEIKRSKADFLNDFKKEHCHYHKNIKSFYYCIPEKMQAYVEDYLVNDVNLLGEKTRNLKSRAGLIIITKLYDDYYARVILDGVKNNNAVPLNDKEQYQLARLGCMRIWNLKKKIIDIKVKELL